MTLNKRYLRNIKENLSFYIASSVLTVVALLLFYLFYIAGSGIKKYGDEFFEKYNLEDATFTTYLEIPDEKNSDIESRYNTTMINVYDLYSKLVDLDIPKEDARFVLMQGVKTSIQMTFNFAALYRFFEMRLCNRAQWEIRNVAKMMATLMQNHYPGLFNNVGPRCQYLGWCPEHKGCGKYLPKKDVTVISNTLLKELTNVRQDTMVIDKYKEIIDALQNDKEQLAKENEQYVETIKKLSFCIATGTPLDFEYRKNPWTKNLNE